jgi:hypothetical protein
MVIICRSADHVPLGAILWWAHPSHVQLGDVKLAPPRNVKKTSMNYRLYRYYIYIFTNWIVKPKPTNSYHKPTRTQNVIIKIPIFLLKSCSKHIESSFISWSNRHGLCQRSPQPWKRRRPSRGFSGDWSGTGDSSHRSIDRNDYSEP